MEENQKSGHLLKAELEALIKDEPLALPNFCNAAALLFESLRDVNWVGFYFVKDEDLVLGPFEGRPACIRIAKGKGVCGTAWEKDEPLVVADVHAFSGHIACDADSASEMVIPLHDEKGAVAGVLDIDSPVKDRFQKEDADLLTEIAGILEDHCLKETANKSRGEGQEDE